MKNYTITVNGNVYDVTAEENGAGVTPAATAPRAAAKKAPAAPKAAPKAVPKKSVTTRFDDLFSDDEDKGADEEEKLPWEQ